MSDLIRCQLLGFLSSEINEKSPRPVLSFSGFLKALYCGYSNTTINVGCPHIVNLSESGLSQLVCDCVAGPGTSVVAASSLALFSFSATFADVMQQS